MRARQVAELFARRGQVLLGREQVGVVGIQHPFARRMHVLVELVRTQQVPQPAARVLRSYHRTVQQAWDDRWSKVITDDATEE